LKPAWRLLSDSPLSEATHRANGIRFPNALDVPTMQQLVPAFQPQGRQL